MRKYILLLTFCLAVCGLQAELIWTEDEGWHPVPSYAEFDNEPKQALDLMNAAKRDHNNGRLNAALSKYVIVRKKFSQSVFAPEAYYQIGMIKLEKRQFNDAFRAFSSITKKYPGYSRFNDVLHQQFEIANMIERGVRPKYFGIVPGFKDYYAAVGFYKKIIDEAPFSDIAPKALLSIGELSLRKKKPLETVQAFERLIDEYPYSEYAPEAYLQLGNFYANIVKSPEYNQGSTKQALGYYEDFLTLYPSHSKVDEVRAICEQLRIKQAKSKLLMGDFYFNSRNNPKSACIMYNAAIQQLPDSEVAIEAKRKIQDLKDGKMPKRTPVDFLFGPYERPTDEQFVESANVEAKNEASFEAEPFNLNFINTGNDDVDLKFVDPDDPKPETPFIKFGPNGTF